MATGGIQRFEIDSNCNNIFAGTCAGSLARGCHNIAAGFCALGVQTTSCYNTAFGYLAGECVTTGTCNMLFGTSAGQRITTGSNNTLFGHGAGTTMTTGVNNTFIGAGAGTDNLIGIRNVALGYFTAQYSQSASDNISIGTFAGQYTEGCKNIMIGEFAGAYTCISSAPKNNIGLGSRTFYGIGLYDVDETIVGCNPPFGLNGCENIAMGHRAGAFLTTGNNNIFIGCCTGSSTAGLGKLTGTSNRILLGNSSHNCACIQIAWTVASDIRDKCIFGPVPHGKNFLNAINPITYSFKNRETNELTETKKRYGFSAQEVLAAEGDNPIIVGSDSPDKLGLTHEYIIPILVNAVKELTQDVEELRAEIAELKKRV
jgi:hypothetical protein